MSLAVLRGTEVLTGWRGWKVLHPHYLVGGNLVYEPRTRHEAHCNSDHLAPDVDCTCGIYSFKTLDEMRSQSYINQDILGEVYLWGKVIEHERGYKAQYAYPKKLYVGRQCSSSVMGIDIEALAPLIGHLYGIPIEVNAQIARHANPNYTYAVTPNGRKISNLYKLPPRQMAVLELLRTLEDAAVGPISKNQLMKAVKANQSLKSTVIEGWGAKNSGPKDSWKLFLSVENNWINKGLITRTF